MRFQQPRGLEGIRGVRLFPTGAGGWHIKPRRPVPEGFRPNGASQCFLQVGLQAGPVPEETFQLSLHASEDRPRGLVRVAAVLAVVSMKE